MIIPLNDPNPSCPECGSIDGLEKIIFAPKVTRVAGPSGPIWDEKQIESTHGKNWRETAKNPYREGGDRKKTYSYQR